MSITQAHKRETIERRTPAWRRESVLFGKEPRLIVRGYPVDGGQHAVRSVWVTLTGNGRFAILVCAYENEGWIGELKIKRANLHEMLLCLVGPYGAAD